MLPNVVLIGMPGSGKSTVGRPLAEALGYTFLDTDECIEIGENKPLSAVLAETTHEDFIELEARYIQELDCRRTVISTGGSVIYDETGMMHLRGLGTVVFLDVAIEILEIRLADLAARGVVIAPGKSIADLAGERRPHYVRYADLIVPCNNASPEANARNIVARLAETPSRFTNRS